MAKREPSHWLRKVIIALGFLAVVVGGADVSARLSKNMFGENASLVAFAPAMLLLDPSLAGSIVPNVAPTPLTPVRLVVAPLQIDAKVEPVGKKTDGSMATPSTFYTTAWYKDGPKPGEAGNAVLAGHVNNALGLAGVFEHLNQIKIGDTVKVFDAEGKQLAFIVEKINNYPRLDAPLEEIFATTGPARLVLITCDGDWSAQARSYEKRLVVVARLSSL